MALGIGVNASAPQPDNQTRTYPLTIGVEGKLYPSFAIEMLRVNTGKPSYIIKTTDVGVSEIAVPPYDPVITQPEGTAFIRFNNTFEEIEYTRAESLTNLGIKYVIIEVKTEENANNIQTQIQ